MIYFSRLLLTCLTAGLICTPYSMAKESSDWQTISVPGDWEAQAESLKDYDGYAWYRSFVKVPSKWTVVEEDIDEFNGSKNLYAQSVSILTKHVADAHEIYVNGQKIGTTGSFPPDYESGYEDYQRWKVPAGLLKDGQYNVISIRVYNHEGPGGMRKTAPVIMGYFTECTLAGKWEFRTGDDPNWAIGSIDEQPEVAVYEEFTISRSQLNRPEKLMHGKKLSPEESMTKMTVADDLDLDQVLTEPLVAQPVGMTFDERGRLWIAQYRQYPYPAGMKILSRDKYYRAVYDRMSPPPPNHFKGMDRISIHEDTDGDGTFDSHKTFLDDLNIAVSVLPGRGGVWVMNPPYLLFYPDSNQDDIPDGPPEVHLEGFGLQDTHSVPNSLRWGPDGWIYFVQGSTVSSNVRTPDMEEDEAIYCEAKGTWRYHPETKRVELFNEGGYNAFGFDFDSRGRLFCGQNIGNARAIHNIQGAYYPKRAGNKYGPISNPYTFGTLEKMDHSPETPRFNHTVIRYEDRGMPERFQGKLVSVDPLHQNAYLTELNPLGSTFQTHDIGEPLRSTDIGFRPVDLCVGPDGAIYIGDYYEEFIAHGQHYQGQVDPTTGRIYRLRADGEKRYPQLNLGEKSSSELVEMLKHPAKWYRSTALRLLGDRKDKSVTPQLKKMLASSEEIASLNALWALNLIGSFDESLARETMRHENPHVRLWTVRLLCDRPEVTTEMASRMLELAENEPDPEVRSQMAASAKRLPGHQAIPIVEALYGYEQDVDDQHIPLLLWWVIEDNAKQHRDQILQLFEKPEFRQQPLVLSSLMERTMKRYAMSGERADLRACADLLKMTSEQGGQEKLLTGFEEAYRGRSLSRIPEELASQLASAGGGSIALQMRMGNQSAIDDAMERLAQRKGSVQELIELVSVTGELQVPEAQSHLLKLLENSTSEELQKALLTALLNYKDQKVAEVVINSYSDFSEDVKQVALTLLVSRPGWSKELLKAVDRGEIQRSGIADDTVRKMMIHQDESVQQLISKHWSHLESASNEQIQQRIAEVQKILEGEPGDLYRGREVYMETCAKCHVLYTDGKRVGPELTQYKRDDQLRMVINIVNPSSEIREGYENYLVVDIDGRVTTGFLYDQDEHVVVLRGADGQDITIPRENIEEMVRQPKSLMPEGLLDKLTDDQIRDLFAYLKTGQPLAK